MHPIRPQMWVDPAIWRIAVVVAGLVFPPLLGLIAVLRGWKQRQAGKVSLLALGTAVIANWSVFVFYLLSDQLGGLGVNYILGRFAGVFLILSLSLTILSIRAASFRWGIVLANFLVLVMWFSLAYAPYHWLERIDFVTVKVDDRVVPAAVYLGNPRPSEAEAIAVVDVPGVGDYFLDFGEETFRAASKYELVALPFGAWMWREMGHGNFGRPLPFRSVNEYRIPLSSGRVLTIAF